MADGVKIMDEKRTISLYLVDGERLLVVDSDLWADVCPITFGDTKEGAFGVRVRTEMTEQKGKGIITNAEGKTGEKELLGSHFGMVRLLRAVGRQGGRHYAYGRS